ncbi:UNVERIFIED_CONTAM: hypothetical protein LK11_07030 [Mumia flava]
MRLDAAAVSTYSLDLTSLLMAPLAMAAHEITSSGVTDPLALLEAVRRYADRTTVFCQAGAIHVPPEYQRLVTFAERCVVEVATADEGTFHPKVWLLRFAGADGSEHHRTLVLSRNLTRDQSWDTILQLDEAAEDTQRVLDGEKVAQFFGRLPQLALRPLPGVHGDSVASLAASARMVRFELPAGFHDGEFLGIGLDPGDRWPLPEVADRLLVVSPFLDRTTIDRLPDSNDTVVVSRAETLDRIGRTALEGISTFVLQAPAESDEADPNGTDQRGQNASSASRGTADSASSLLEPTRGLHAKLFAWDSGHESHLLTGSANATSAAFRRNVEASVLLSGRRAQAGVEAILDDPSLGLRRVLQEYVPTTDDGTSDEDMRAERDLEAFHLALAEAGATLHVTGRDDGYHDLQLTLDAAVPSVGETAIRPISLPARVHRRSWAGGPVTWAEVDTKDLTPFVAIETTLERDGRTTVRSCVITANLVGAPETRARTVLRSLVENERDLLRLLALLLQDPSFDPGFLASSSTESEGTGERRPIFDDLVLLEPLVRAAARGDDGLDRVARLFEDLSDEDNHVPYLTDEIATLWKTVWAAKKASA